MALGFRGLEIRYKKSDPKVAFQLYLKGIIIFSSLQLVRKLLQYRLLQCC